MTIEWNKVTWYSKVLAIVVFIATFYVAFYLGAEYRNIKSEVPNEGYTNTLPTKGSDVVMKVGETIEYGDLKIKLNSIVSDSRCPVDPNIRCITAGFVSVSVTLTEGSTVETRTISSTNTTVGKFGYYEIRIGQEITPAPGAGKKIPDGDYRIPFHLDVLTHQ